MSNFTASIPFDEWLALTNKMRGVCEEVIAQAYVSDKSIIAATEIQNYLDNTILPLTMAEEEHAKPTLN